MKFFIYGRLNKITITHHIASFGIQTVLAYFGRDNGFGARFSQTGMTWSAFRPSDDCCQYSYLIPSNMLVVVLGYVQEIFGNIETSR